MQNPDRLNQVASLTAKHPDGTTESYGKVRVAEGLGGLSVYAADPNGTKDGDQMGGGVTRVLFFEGLDAVELPTHKRSRRAWAWVGPDGTEYNLAGCSQCGTPASIKRFDPPL